MALSFSNTHIPVMAKGQKMVISNITLDNSYPTNGWAVAANDLNLTAIRAAIFPGCKSGYGLEWDQANLKIKAYASPGHTHDMLVIGGITADEDVGLLASGPTLGKLAATDRTVAGADSATKGGVVASSAAAMSELANTSSVLNGAIVTAVFIGY